MLIFRNPGLIDLDAVRTLGVSVKLPGSFGRFGTGLKFAIATILRDGGTIHIVRGHQRHDFGTTELDVRGQKFQLVTLDGESMHITTQLGRDWEAWMVLRELGCNALDEGGAFGSTAEGFPTDRLRKDETTIAVEWFALEEAYAGRKELFIEGPPLWQDENLRILPGPSQHIFYRGIRVFKLDKPSVFTYDVLAEQALTEDRTLAGMWRVDGLIGDAMMTMENSEIIDQALRADEDHHESKVDYESSYWISSKPSRAFLDAAVNAREAGKLKNPTAKKVLMKHIRESKTPIGGSGYRRVVDDALGYALDQLGEIGIKFEDSQHFVIVEELPGETLSMAENGRVYYLKAMSALPARKIAGELLARWVDLNAKGSEMDDVVKLLTPIILNRCPTLKKDEQMAKEDAAEPIEAALRSLFVPPVARQYADDIPW